MRLIPDEVWGAANIWAEARGEPHEGQVAVGFVVRERARLRYSSDGSVVGTVWRPSQFSWTLSSDPQRLQVLAADDIHLSVREARDAWLESATTTILPPKTVLYHADYVNPHPAWASSPDIEFVRQIGRHLFYKLRG